MPDCMILMWPQKQILVPDMSIKSRHAKCSMPRIPWINLTNVEWFIILIVVGAVSVT